MRKLRMEYQPTNSFLWLVIGEWFEDDNDSRDAFYREADAMRGLLRVMSVHTGNVIFQRPTQVTPKITSDDCHTYS